ncbi:LysM peptidoglycan-binding domain-containing protein [Anoxybacterium hadale]|uniref:LysM peptidoglycan-binding domain-containing protein n=2 Tax=Anoxybacterium hadale TaxID=3408580 RepID=A0ACD1AHH1_9FIRM|nr:LysM peptidoglycan-binding domain-containing protein [Clostridiales bacterium]
MLIYTVKPGDELVQLASDFQVSPEMIIAVNGLPNPFRLLTGQSLIIPTAEPEIPKTEASVNGYLYFLGENGVPIVRETAPFLTSVTPFSYIVKENGGLRTIDDEPIIAAALENQVTPVMCITNFSATVKGQNIANVVLNNEESIQNLLNNIIFTMKYKGYQGLNIDFEYVLPEDRENYNSFLALAADALHREGYFITTAVAPKTGPDQKGLLYEAIDYPVHGMLMDYVILMTYEWGYRFGPPQAISPLNQIKRVLDYAVTVIPREKLYFGFQIYARDWKLPHIQGREAETISCQAALERAVYYDAVIQYDELAESPYYRYQDEEGREHEVWFEDARSAQAKFNAVKEYGLEGISYWVLGYPFPQNWTLLYENFDIVSSITSTI